MMHETTFILVREYLSEWLKLLETITAGKFPLAQLYFLIAHFLMACNVEFKIKFSQE